MESFEIDIKIIKTFPWDSVSNMNRESADWKILEYLEYGAWHVPCPAWLVLWIELQWQSFKPCRCLDSGLAVKFCVGVQEPFCFSFA